MSSKAQYILLPILGVLSAILAFAIASPYDYTLIRPELSPFDPAAYFTTGTLWDIVEHVAFGALLLGSFCFVITLPRGPKAAIGRGLLGALAGAIIVPVTNSGADMLGMQSMKQGLLGSAMGSFAWCLFVPTGMAFVLALCLGPSTQRLTRAAIASGVGFFAALFVQHGLGPLLLIAATMSKGLGFNILKGGSDLRSGIPTWRLMDCSIGLTLGLLFAAAENLVRAGYIRLSLGRNEYRDYNLDAVQNRVGSQEGNEVFLRGFQNVEPVHAVILCQAGRFIVHPQAPTLVNGQNCQTAVLNSGDSIQVGGACLIFMHQGTSRSYSQPMPQMPQYAVAPQPFPQPFVNAQPLAPQAMAPQALVPQALGPQAIGAQPFSPQPISPGFLLRSDLGSVYPLSDGVTTIGREPSNGIALSFDSRVSRQHAILQVSSGNLVLKDLASKNGTKVNGQPISETPLQLGDVIEIGGVRLNVER